MEARRRPRWREGTPHGRGGALGRRRDVVELQSLGVPEHGALAAWRREREHAGVEQVAVCMIGPRHPPTALVVEQLGRVG